MRVYPDQQWILFDCFIMRNRIRFIVYHFACYIWLDPNLIILKIGPPGEAISGGLAAIEGSDSLALTCCIFN